MPWDNQSPIKTFRYTHRHQGKRPDSWRYRNVLAEQHVRYRLVARSCLYKETIDVRCAEQGEFFFVVGSISARSVMAMY